MELINEIYSHGSLTKDELEVYITLLCPFAPHLTEEIHSQLGGKGLLSLAKWPEYDEAKTVDATVEIAVQINGKLKGTYVIAKGADKDSVLAQVKADAKFTPLVDGKTVVKEIYVPDKLVNLVVK